MMIKKSAKAALDKLFSIYIRTRAMERVGGCERCLTRKKGIGQLHCAHFHGRRKQSVRWHEDNAAGLCPGCHRYLDDQAQEKVDWFRNYLGEDRYDIINIAAGIPQKQDIELLTKYFEQKLEVIE